MELDATDKTHEALTEELAALKQQVADLKAHEQTLQERVRMLEKLRDAQVQADQEIIRFERLHALEEMAQGVAHNFNNVLVGVLGYAQIVEMQSREPQTVANARKIVENALRAKELVRRLNRSVREADDLPLRRITALNVTVREAIKAAQPQQDASATRGIRIAIVETLREVPAVAGNPIELHHVLMHLIANAIDAMPEGGDIEISTRPEKNGVAICVKDHGIGMTSETRKRIFEPFFTTKHDVGSGLGLAMAYRTITGWGGRIDVDSVPGKGSAFTVWLPVWSNINPKKTETSLSKVRILAVDDEAAVHEILQASLSAYDLTCYGTGEEALAQFEAGRFELALIDLQLPGISGDELVRGLQKTDPNLIAVLMTGWEVAPDDPRLNLFAYRVLKPFHLKEMIATVQQALSEKKATG